MSLRYVRECDTCHVIATGFQQVGWIMVEHEVPAGLTGRYTTKQRWDYCSEAHFVSARDSIGTRVVPPRPEPPPPRSIPKGL